MSAVVWVLLVIVLVVVSIGFAGVISHNSHAVSAEAAIAPSRLLTPAAIGTTNPSPPPGGSRAPSLDDDLYVVSSHYNEDVSWLDQLGMPYSVCDKVGNPKYAGTGDCDVPMNRGRECSSYVQFIINHYDNLPKRIAFVHGHENAWHHQSNLPSILKLAKEHITPDHGFTSLNDMVLCLWRRCPRRENLLCDQKKRDKVMPFWDKHFVPYLNDSWPTECCSGWNDCCAQFVVSREDVLRNPKSSYEAMLADLLDTRYDDVGICFGLETVWHAIFGEKLCAEWSGDCPIDHTIGARLQHLENAPPCLTAKRP